MKQLYNKIIEALVMTLDTFMNLIGSVHDVSKIIKAETESSVNEYNNKPQETKPAP